MRNLSRRFLRTAVDLETLRARGVPSLSRTGASLADRVSLAAVTALVIAKRVLVRDGHLGILHPSMN
jgi:hypothetical protein